MPKKNPLRRKPRKDRALQKQQQRQSVKQNVIVNLAAPQKARRTRSGGGTAIRSARVRAIPEINYRFKQTIDLPQTYTENVAAPTANTRAQMERQDEVVRNTARQEAALNSAFNMADFMRQRYSALEDDASFMRAPKVNAPLDISPPVQIEAAPELADGGGGAVQSFNDAAASPLELVGSAAAAVSQPEPSPLKRGRPPLPAEEKQRRMELLKSDKEAYKREAFGRKQDAAKSFLQKKVEEGRRKMKKEAVAREEADKALRLSQMVREGATPRDEETASGSTATEVVTPLGRPPPFVGGGASRGGLMAEIGAGVKLKRSTPPSSGDGAAKKNPFLADIEGGRKGLKKSSAAIPPLGGKKPMSNPLFNKSNPMLDNPMFKMRQRMAAEDDSGF